MERTCFYILLGSMTLVSIVIANCNCTCGSFSSPLTSNCSSAPSCASACHSGYNSYGCNYNNTYGCCGGGCSNYTQAYCRCMCGGYMLLPAATCSSALQCGYICASLYSICTTNNNNPYGCCDLSCDIYYSNLCTCYCGSSTYYTSSQSYSAWNCASMCYSNYSNCLSSNTYGCMGSSCTWYSSPATGSTCNCLCSTANSTLPYPVGNVSLSSCTTNSCQSYCHSAYSSSCGTYINNAYCSGSATGGTAGGTTNPSRSQVVSHYQAVTMLAITAGFGTLTYSGQYY